MKFKRLFLIVILLFSLIFPFGAPVKEIQASGNEEVLFPTKIKAVEKGVNSAIFHEVCNPQRLADAGVVLIPLCTDTGINKMTGILGHHAWFGEDEQFVSEIVSQYDLSTIDPQLIETAQLRFYVEYSVQGNAGEGTSDGYVNIGGSNNDTWSISDLGIPNIDEEIINNASVPNHNTDYNFDVTNFVKAQASGNQLATFVLTGPPEGSQMYTQIVPWRFDGQTSNSTDYVRLVITLKQNSPPTDISLTSTEIEEKEPAGTVVGLLDAIDEDVDETFTFSLVSGDTGSFTIVDNELRTAEEFDYATKNSYNIRIRVEDSLNQAYEKDFIIQVKQNLPPTGSITINSGAPYTNSSNVNLGISASDPEGDAIEMRLRNASGDWGTWEAYVTSKTWVLSEGDGTKTVELQLRDAKSTQATTFSDSIILDTTPPTGTITINSGATHTNNSKVTLTVSGIDVNGVAEMRFSNEHSTWSAWEPYVTSKAWTLSAGDGEKTVYMQLRDVASNVTIAEISDSIALDTEPPVVSGVTNGGLYNEPLALTFNKGAGTLNGTAFTSGSIVSEEGVYTLVVTDNAGNTTTVSFSIDLTSPTGSVEINGGAEITNNVNVNLAITGDDSNGPVQMRFSNDNSTWSSWEALTSTKSWSLAAGDGEKTVYMELRDAVGNVDVFSSNIILDETAPSGNLEINDGAQITNNINVTLGITGDDPNGPLQMRFSNDNSTWSSWESLSETKAWELATGDGEKTVYMELRDAAGNIATFNNTIELDTAAPVVTGVVHEGVYNTDVTISYNKGTATLNGSPFVNGGSVSTEGSYTLVVTDAAGNTTTVSFSIDTTPPTGNIEINGGAELTNNVNVDLAITGEDPNIPVQMRFSNDNSTWSAWEALSSTKSWNLASGDGTKTVYMELRDAVGNVAVFSSNIVLDETPPSGNLEINDGAENTNNINVTLKISGEDTNGPLEMRFSNDNSTWSSWEALSETKAWELVTGDGEKTVHMELRDAAGNVAVFEASIELDGTPPVVTGVDHEGFYNTTVTISFNKGTATLNGSPFVSGSSVSSEGSYTLVVTDAAGNITTVSFSIDTTPPTGSVEINGGAELTNNVDVNLAIAGDDPNGSVQMRFSNDNSTWTSWEALSSTKSWSLAAGDGEKTVYMELQDAVGNVAVFSSNIILDETAPSGNLEINDGAEVTNNINVTLGITGEDPNGPVQMRFSNDNSTWSSWEDLSETKAWELATGDGEKTVYMELRDAAGNVAVFEASIELDGTPAEVTGVDHEGIYNTDVTISFNKGTATLNGSPYVSGSTVSAEGSYTLVVTDVAGNITTVEFLLDKTSPQVEYSPNGNSEAKSSQATTVNIEDPLSGIASTKYQWTTSENFPTEGSWTQVENGKSISIENVNGEYYLHIIAIDYAGNETKITSLPFQLRYTPPSSGGGGSIPAAEEKTILVNPSNSKTVESGGVVIKLPAGVLQGNFQITIEKVSAPLREEWNPQEKVIISDIYEITKDQQGDFKEDVTITLPFNKEGIDLDQYEVAIYWLNEKTGEWIKLNNIVLDWALGKVSGDVDHFTKFAVLITEKVPVEMTDIAGHWAENNIKKLVALNVISGFPDQTFKPNSPITRAEFTAIVVRALGLKTNGSKIFSDTRNHWAKDIIAIAFEHGIINGYNDITFGANDLITREQMATIIANAFELEMGVGKVFVDRDMISAWAREAIDLASSNEIITGYHDGSFKPKRNATRAEAVSVIVRLLKSE